MAPVLGDGHTAAPSGRADFERPDSFTEAATNTRLWTISSDSEKAI